MQGTLGLKSTETPWGVNLSKRIDQSWYNNERVHAFLNSNDMKVIINALSYYKNTLKHNVYPESDLILRALRLPMPSARVIILGQDPYHSPKGQATGLAFSCGISASPSLLSIFECIYRTVYNSSPEEFIHKYMDYYVDSDFPSVEPIEAMPIDLVRWSRQGILLLNTHLTVKSGQAMSHSELGWDKFTNIIIEELDKQPHEKVFLLWGKPAQKAAKYIKHSKIMVCEHPVAPAYRDENWYCTHFVDVLSIFSDIIW